MTRLVSSPLFVLSPTLEGVRAIDLVSGSRFRGLSPQAIELSLFFLRARPASDALGEGYSEATVREALDAGILLEEGSPTYEAGRLWEDRCWSRAAFLLLSQQNLRYADVGREFSSLAELADLRRRSVNRFLEQGEYPSRRWKDEEGEISLPRSGPVEPALDAILERRSVRVFSGAPVSADTLGRVLATCTRNVRTADQSMAQGDSYFLLNAFYSWLSVYVVVQRVEDVERGVYQYRPATHSLLAQSPGTVSASDESIARCIQQQRWIGGGGFCLFVVVDWERYMYLFRYSRAYINLLVQVGEFGQEVLQAAYAVGLGGWLTPAVDERTSADLLGLDSDSEDAMYFLKLGYPHPHSVKRSGPDA